MRTTVRRRTTTGAAFALAVTLALTACGAEKGTTAEATGDGKPDRARAAVKDPLVATFDGGLYLLDGRTLKRAGTVGLPGFNRVNPAGDDTHVMVSTDTGFRVLDTSAGALTGVEFKGAEPGHVVRHAGKTVLFTDGTGDIHVFDPDDLAAGTKPGGRTHTTDKPHHGVAVELKNGELLTTLGDDEKRTGAVVLDRNGKETARSENCPGVHGEAAAQGEAIALGCEDGALIYRNGAFTKVKSPDRHGRIGTQAGSDVSPILLGDYKTDPEAELERPERVSLIDTRTGTMRLVDLGTSYSFRSLARGPHGEALVLGTDGSLHVIDPGKAEVTRSIPAVGAWREPLDWQQPRPVLFVRGHTAYISEPGKRRIHAFDIASGKRQATVTLPEAPNELTGVVAGH
ncbi:zinc metallochaperone AztD [Streptomyces sp. NPDC003691]